MKQIVFLESLVNQYSYQIIFSESLNKYIASTVDFPELYFENENEGWCIWGIQCKIMVELERRLANRERIPEPLNA
jgi:hypothetical protein